MKTISPPITLIQQVNNEQRIKENTEYRGCAHCIQTPCGEGILLYQTMTGEILLLSPEEWENREKDKALRDALIRHWFLVPKDHDEKKHADQILGLAGMLMPKDTGIDSFSIFTTLDCNARCFYCFEKGRDRTAMSEQTSRDAADYIARVSQGQQVKIHWFGGEPLFNQTAIDTIVSGLRSKGVSFRSKMHSNAYLFDPTLVKKAKEEWRLEDVQITIDGTEEVYNRTKAYIYREGSPYRRVMRNIGLLLDAEITVHARLNMTDQNAEDLKTLVDELHERFGGRRGLTVYVAPVVKPDAVYRGPYAGAAGIMDIKTEIVNRIQQYGMYDNKRVRQTVKANFCMADCDQAVTILPDGKIGKCDHYSDKGIIGTIYSDELDRGEMKIWREKLDLPECRHCTVYPVCGKLKKCGWDVERCSDLRREDLLFAIRQQILYTYEKERDQS